MKTFKELTVGDKFFKAIEASMKYETFEVGRVDSDSIEYNYSDKIKRIDKPSFKMEANYYNNYRQYLFTQESDAIRYCKAQMMKTLFNTIEAAKKSIQSVYNLRNENYELLNHEWTEKQINLLEQSL